ncbi:hypothetical protein, partial [Nonomuraea jabiensis]|uniref:hypothetical protein n=1 Tax=Nonomuraea jabiensis TaxID=882448 RepID=UPI0036A94491
GRPMDGQALSKPALLAHQAVLDQQIKDPLLLVGILSARIQRRLEINRLRYCTCATTLEDKQAGPPKDRRACLGWMARVVVVPVWFGRVISRAVWAPAAAVLTRAAVDSAAARATSG